MPNYTRELDETLQEKWVKKKQSSLLLSESLERLDYLKHSHWVKNCASYLIFGECPNGHELQLRRAYFCRNRLCSVCIWRKSLATYHQSYQIAHEAFQRRSDLSFIFLTLTIKNVEGDMLSDAITQLLQAFNRFMKRREWNRYIVGWMRSLEVTRNKSRGSKNYGTYHPHFHILIAVPPEYYKSGYKTQKQIQTLWRESLRIDYDPTVDVRKVKPKKVVEEAWGDFVEVQDSSHDPKIVGAVAEVSKYTVSENSYLDANNLDWTDSSVKTLMESLHKRRLVAYGGLLKEIKLELGLEEDTDLVDVAGKKKCQCSVCQSDYLDIGYSYVGQTYFGKEVDFKKMLHNEHISRVRRKLDKLMSKPKDIELKEIPFVMTVERKKELDDRLEHMTRVSEAMTKRYKLDDHEFVRNVRAELQNWINIHEALPEYEKDGYCPISASPVIGANLISDLEDLEEIFGLS